MTGRPRPAGARLLRLYPRAWRERYESEMLAVLEQFRLGPRGRLDLARGAIDARLNALSPLPAAAALLAGGLWTFGGAGIVTQPAPPDWPGYLLETLPLAMIAVAAGGVATLGCWARRRDAAGRMGVVAIWCSIVGHVAWFVALAAAFVGLGYGPVTAVAQDLGAVGCLLVGIVLLRTGDERIGGLLVLAPTLMMFGWPAAWLAFGLAWTLVGVLLLVRPESDAPSSPRFA